MKKKLITIVLIYSILLLAVTALWLHGLRKTDERKQGSKENVNVTINELKQVYANRDDARFEEICEILTDKGEQEQPPDSMFSGKNGVLWLLAGLNILFMAILSFCLYIRILRPFKKLENYASLIAQGNLDLPLEMERGNYFGDFTWAFDTMRKEIAKSREAEKNAIENNKIVIASLSHDIKTPVASIRAYAEAFEANLYTSPEKKQKYLTTIMNKCDEVSKLTNDLFNHSLTEMNKLEVKMERIELNSFLREKTMELFVNPDDVELKLPDQKEIYVNADAKRLQQIAENLINNTAKYAKTRMEISVETDHDFVSIYFRDFGTGIPEEEIPFIKGKFYRGKNVGDENGSGLGLYIVDELTRKMGGRVELYNKTPGLLVVVSLQKAD